MDNNNKTVCKEVVTGDIMAISRLRMAQDGQGVSTLVGFFNCPLKCKYCINYDCHKFYELYGKPRFAYKPEVLFEVLKKDEIYYLMTGGGVVFGGGEPLLQSEFIHEVCKLIGSRWIKRIETSLNVSWDMVETLIDDIDEWIVDIKDMNNAIYIKYTGSDNTNVKENLLKMKQRIPLKRLHIRIPYIQGFNTTEDVVKSVEWIRENLGIEPEVFKYDTTPIRTYSKINDMPPWLTRRQI